MTNLADPGQLFVEALHAAGVTLVATLPDAWLGGFIDAAGQDPAIRLVRVTREDEGVGICAGAYLGGARAVLLAQSAGGPAVGKRFGRAGDASPDPTADGRRGSRRDR